MNILSKKSGYTLMEMMVVVLIIGILALAGMPYYEEHLERQIAASGITNLRMIANSLERYMATHGDTLPDNFDFTKLDIDIDQSKLSNENRSYIEGNLVFTIDIDRNAVVATRTAGSEDTPTYTLTYSLEDTGSSDDGIITCFSESDPDFCSDKLHISCGS